MSEDQLAQAYRRHAALLAAVARSVLGDGAEAEDCLHDVLVRLLRGSFAYRPERGELRAFLIVCVRNEALARRRAGARHRELDRRAAQSQPPPEDPFARIDPVEHQRLARALASLPADQRAVIELAYFGQRSQSEIAAALGAPLGTVKSRVSLALRKLALALSPNGSP